MRDAAPPQADRSQIETRAELRIGDCLADEVGCRRHDDLGQADFLRAVGEIGAVQRHFFKREALANGSDVGIGGGAIDEQDIVGLQFRPWRRLHDLASEPPMALDRDDMPEATRAVHTLKGGAGTIGANELAHLCREIEQIAKAGDQVGVAELLPTLDRELSRALTALQAIRTSQAA